MNLSKNIFKGIRNAGKKKEVNIELYQYCSCLYEILNANGLIQVLKDTSLLGNIYVKKSQTYTRFDYVMMQVYIYQFIKNHLNDELEISLNNKFKCQELKNKTIELVDDDFKSKAPTISDVLQILSFIYNIGHFKNTFSSSRAVLNLITREKEIREGFLNCFKYDAHKKIAIDIIEKNNYLNFHLLNSLLILSRLDSNEVIVKFSINILTEYLSPLSKQSEKTKYIFELFRIIREVCYMTLDLSIAPVPIFLDIHNDKHLKTLLRERVSGYNDQKQITNLFNGLNKLLQDTVYNEENSSIIQYDITRRMEYRVLKSEFLMNSMIENYSDLINAKGNELDVFNKRYPRSNDFDKYNILKLSFSIKQQYAMEELVKKLNSTNFVKVAWYYRSNENRITILVSVKNNCSNKTEVAFKVLKIILNIINNLELEEGVDSYHSQALLTTKFFLYYLLGGNKIILEGKLDSLVCVYLNRGKNSRVKSLKKLIDNAKIASKDDIHEIEVLRNILLNETKNDLCLTVCSSILVKDNKINSIPLAEFDGLIIFPNRMEKQIIFVESKNRKEKPSYSKRCLIEKFKTIGIQYAEEDIDIFNRDCKYYYTI